MTADEGRPVTSDDWTALVQRSLRGRGVDELSSVTRDGIEIRPLYTEGPAPPASARVADPARSEHGWDARVSHRVDAGTGQGTVAATRDRIAEDLMGGATSVEIEVRSGSAIAELDEVLPSIDLGGTPVALAPHAEPGLAEALVAAMARRGGPLAAGSSLGLDPAGEWARSGREVGCGGSAASAAELAASGRLGAGVMVFTVDAARYTDAGATEAQVLGWATATGVAYLRALVDAGCSADAAAGLIGFRLAVTADQFVTIAALRAARMMWSRVVTACGGSDAAVQQYQHAVTAVSMYSRRDPWVNLLRGTTAGLAAGVARADAVTVLPFDCAAGHVDADGALGRRLARNTQLLLLEESHLARAADPAGGSFYVESLTDELARAGWQILQQTEQAGGIASVTADGSLAAAIEQRWQDRLADLRTRRDALTGVSEFPLLDDVEDSREEPSEFPLLDDVEGSRGEPSEVPAPVAGGLPIRHLAQIFDDLRDAADRHRIDTGTRPAAWVAALGSQAGHSVRTAWAQNLLAVGGIEARGGQGVESPVAAAADFAASGLSAAVITGTDDMYERRAVATAAALADAGAAFVAVVCDANTPAERLEELESRGVNDFWHQGMDVVDALERLHVILGVA